MGASASRGAAASQIEGSSPSKGPSWLSASSHSAIGGCWEVAVSRLESIGLFLMFQTTNVALYFPQALVVVPGVQAAECRGDGRLGAARLDLMKSLAIGAATVVIVNRQG